MFSQDEFKKYTNEIVQGIKQGKLTEINLSNKKIVLPKQLNLSDLLLGSSCEDTWGAISLDGTIVKEEDTRDLTLADVEPILQVLVNNKQIRKVNLQNVRLGDEAAPIIAEILQSKNNKIESLDIRDTGISKANALVLLEFCRQHKPIIKLEHESIIEAVVDNQVEIKKMEQKITAMAQQMQEISSTLTRLNPEEKINQAVGYLRLELMDRDERLLKAQKDFLETELSELQKKLNSQINEERIAANKQVIDIRSKLSALEKEQVANTEELKHTRSSVDEKFTLFEQDFANKLADLKSCFEQTKQYLAKQYSEQKSKLEQQLKAVESQLTEFKGDVAQIKRTHERLQKEQKELIAEQKALAEEYHKSCASVEKQFVAKQNEINKLQSQIKETDGKIDKLNKDQIQQKNSLTQLTQELKQTTLEIAEEQKDAKQERQDVLEDIKSMRTELAKIVATVDSLKEDEKVNKVVKDLRAELERREERILRTQEQQLKTELEKLKKDITTGADKNKQKIEEDLKVIQKELQTLEEEQKDQNVNILAVQETNEKLQQRITEIDEDLKKHQAKQQSINEKVINDRLTNIESQLKGLESDVAQVQILKQEQAKLREDQKILLEKHKQESELSAKQIPLNQLPELRFFYQSVKIKLTEVFLAIKAAASGLLEFQTSAGVQSIEKGIELAGDNIPIPGASLAAKAVNKAIDVVTGKNTEAKLALQSSLTDKISTIEIVAEAVARELTYRYQKQLLKLKPEGAKLLADCAMVRIMNYLDDHLNDLVSGSDPQQQIACVVPQLVASVFKVQLKQGFFGIKNKKVPTKDGKLWTESGILTEPGIVAKEEQDDNEICSYYSGEAVINETKQSEFKIKLRPEKYGYRTGTKAEAMTLHLQLLKTETNQDGKKEAAEKEKSKAETKAELKVDATNSKSAVNLTATSNLTSASLVSGSMAQVFTSTYSYNTASILALSSNTAASKI